MLILTVLREAMQLASHTEPSFGLPCPIATDPAGQSSLLVHGAWSLKVGAMQNCNDDTA